MRMACVALLTLAAIGCGVTTTSTSCHNADCDIKLSGNGADTELGSLGLAIELADTDGDKAELKLRRLTGSGREAIALAEGESRTALGALITLEDVDGSKVKLHARGGRG
jgi:hypothetical protein